MKFLSLIVALFLCLVVTPGWAIDPVRDYVNTPEKMGLTYDAQFIATSDGAQLATWSIQPLAPKAQDITFVLAYGDAGNMSYSLPYAYYLTQRGFHVVLFDYRGFGKSSNFPIHKNQFYYPEFATDLSTVIEWTKQQQPNQKVAVWGFSMGTLMAGLTYQATPFDYLIGEAFLIDPLKVVERIEQQKGIKLLLPEGMAKAINTWEHLSIPILGVCGTQDNITTTADFKALSKDVTNRQLLSFEGGHLQGGQVIGLATYLNEIECFIGTKTKAEIVVQRQLDAYNARDIDAFTATYAEHIRVENFPSHEVVLEGRDALRSSYGSFFEKATELHCQIVDRITFQNKVIDHERVMGIPGMDVLEVVAIYEVENDLITKVYFIRQ